MYIGFMAALLLQEIAKSHAEVFTNTDPCNIYINDCQAGSGEIIMPLLEKFKKNSLVDERNVDGLVKVYTVNAAGKEELARHFRKDAVLQQ